VGGLSWALASGILPKNVSLSQGGALYGTPGEAGTYVFTARATDANPAGANSTTRSFTWSIAEAQASPIVIPKSTGTFTVNGVLDEPLWAQATWRPISRNVRGTCTKTGEFALVWNYTGGGRGTLMLGVRVTNGAAGFTPMDAVEVYTEALHNREIVYNADDKHYAACRDQALNRYKGVPTLNHEWWLTGGVSQRATGFTVEWPLSDLDFYGQPSVSRTEYGGLGGGTVYGFDVAIDEGQSESALGRKVWRGSDTDDADPSQFGSLALLDYPLPATAVDSGSPTIWRDGDFTRFLFVPWDFQVDTTKLFVWYSPTENGTAGAKTSGGNPGTFIATGYWEKYLFACVPAQRAVSETWRVSFDRRQSQAYSGSWLRAYGYDIHERLNDGGADKFNQGTQLANQAMANVSSWTATSFDMTVPAGNDIVTFAMFMNTDDANAGIDNFTVTRLSTGAVHSPQALAAARVAPVSGGVRLVVSAESTPVSIDCYDLRGTLVARLARGRLTKGMHTFALGARGAGLAPGQYVVRVDVGGVVSVLATDLVRR
jgi:hypothetical protein